MPFKLRKRIFDLALSIPAFFFLSLLMLIMAVLVRLKFRTMTDARDGDGNLLPDGERLTRLGRFLRKTSMDDPQITQIFAD